MPGLQAVALDYDGTLTTTERPEQEVLEAVRETRRSGRTVVLVTGRILAELRADFPGVDGELDAIVAENGAVIADADGVHDVALPVDAHLADALAHRDVPLRRGRVLLACDARHASTVQEEIALLGLDCQISHNRDSLMVLPSGVTKGTGVAAALSQLGISRHGTIAVGDAENDHHLLETCAVGVAVGNAVDALKQRADVVLDAPNGAGVVELLRGPLLDGRERVWPERWQVEIGHTVDRGEPVRLPASQATVLISGGSASGKSYVAGMVAEQLVRMEYSVLLIDREGEHCGLGRKQGVLTVGGADPLPSPEQLVALVRQRAGGVILDLSLLADRNERAYLDAALPAVLAQREAIGLPNWIFLDEAHRLGVDPALSARAIDNAPGLCYATYQPRDLCDPTVDRIEALVVTSGGRDGAEEVLDFASELIGLPRPELAEELGEEPGRALLWRRDEGGEPVVFQPRWRSTPHVRHWRKYTDSDLPPHLRFYFHPHPQITAASNVRDLHRQLAAAPTDTVDAHARHRDFSTWTREVLQDERLAEAISRVEGRADAPNLPAGAVAEGIRRAIEARYLEDSSAMR
ncbi:hypothetical protein ER308_18380 [Egibacter rhizosphaerae]|uniref:HAD-IIB family hydrolase n=1 Tax=Egibacter rhizosphaerae TaxID=1670831 RepID=A0A411YJJ5_9ACTN|nr:HAD hydrolase family protein [Egibacter rhizosphaerae]QBI21341.1 hypothetical protein ER308_18380 [Egibacter rhizosphaerae]